MAGGSFLTHLLFHPLLRAKEGKDSRTAALDFPCAYVSIPALLWERPTPKAWNGAGDAAPCSPSKAGSVPAAPPELPLWEGTTRGAQETGRQLLSKGVNT